MEIKSESMQAVLEAEFFKITTDVLSMKMRLHK